MYHNIINGKIVEIWQSREAAQDWQEVCGGIVTMTRTHTPRPMPRFIVLSGISTTTRAAARTQRQTRPIPVVLTPEIIARILERRAEQEIDRVEKLYSDYFCEM